MIVDQRNQIGAQRACQAEEDLPLKIVHAVPVVHLGRIGAGAVEHDQPKADQKDHGGHQTVIKVPYTAFHSRPHLLRSGGGSPRAAVSPAAVRHLPDLAVSVVHYIYTPIIVPVYTDAYIITATGDKNKPGEESPSRGALPRAG